MSIELDKFDLNWDKPKRLNGYLNNYEVNIKPIGTKYSSACEDNREISVNVTDNSFQFTNGKSYYEYNCSVRAFTDVGPGETTSIVVLTAPSGKLFL